MEPHHQELWLKEQQVPVHIQKLEGTCNYHQQIQLRHSIKFIEARMTRYVTIRRALEKKM